MKAVLFDRYGAPDVLRVADATKPTPAPGELLIRVHAIGVNPADGKWREGMFKERVPLTLPHIGGYDIAGEIVGGYGAPLGARVAAMLDPVRAGGYAEYAVTSFDRVAMLPDALDFPLAAAVPTPGLTGVQIIEDALDVRPSHRVLITGAIGAVGRFAVFAAKARGAHVIAAVRASAVAEARAIGADEIVTLGDSYAGPEFDRVADTVGGASVAPLCRHVARDAVIKTAATTPIPADGVPVPITFYPVCADSKRLTQLLASVAFDELRVPISAVLPLEQAAEAQRRVEAGGVGGKLILTP